MRNYFWSVNGHDQHDYTNIWHIATNWKYNNVISKS